MLHHDIWFAASNCYDFFNQYSSNLLKKSDGERVKLNAGIELEKGFFTLTNTAIVVLSRLFQHHGGTISHMLALATSSSIMHNNK